jgi:hypothetical protein
MRLTGWILPVLLGTSLAFAVAIARGFDTLSVVAATVVFCAGCATSGTGAKRVVRAVLSAAIAATRDLEADIVKESLDPFATRPK